MITPEPTATTPSERPPAAAAPSDASRNDGDASPQATEPSGDVAEQPTRPADGSAGPTEVPAPPGEQEGRDEDDGEPQPVLARGDRGTAVERLQQRLRELRYWLGPVDGVYGELTEQAVFAFQGVEGLVIDGVTGPDTWSALEAAQPPEPRSGSGDLIEVDEDARVVLDVRDGRVRWVWHTSTGTNQHYQHPAGHTALAETPNGHHTISWQVDGWRRNELGRLWRPKYFHADGIAIHGFHSVPATPSSHGCVRVTVAAMNFIWEHDNAPEGSTVWVYGRPP